MHRISGGMQMRTPRASYAMAADYGPLVAPATGQYRFSLRYKNQSGLFAFGARKDKVQGYLAVDEGGCRVGQSRERSFWVRL